ncbi:Cytosolic enolase 3, partial [Cucurbita argyrosperma subsp. argyrosperma]
MNTKHKLFCKIADAMDAAARAKISDLLRRNPSYICLAGKKMPLNHVRKFVPSVIMKFEARYVLDGRGSSTAEADLNSLPSIRLSALEILLNDNVFELNRKPKKKVECERHDGGAAVTHSKIAFVIHYLALSLNQSRAVELLSAAPR